MGSHAEHNWAESVRIAGIVRIPKKLRHFTKRTSETTSGVLCLVREVLRIREAVELLMEEFHKLG